MITSFALCRVAVFPYMYFAYGAQHDLGVLQVVRKIPVHCNLGSLMVLLPQVHWLRLMLLGALKVSRGSPITEADEKIDWTWPVAEWSVCSHGALEELGPSHVLQANSFQSLQRLKTVHMLSWWSPIKGGDYVGSWCTNGSSSSFEILVCVFSGQKLNLLWISSNTGKKV